MSLPAACTGQPGVTAVSPEHSITPPTNLGMGLEEAARLDDVGKLLVDAQCELLRFAQLVLERCHANHGVEVVQQRCGARFPPSLDDRAAGDREQQQEQADQHR